MKGIASFFTVFAILSLSQAAGHEDFCRLVRTSHFYDCGESAFDYTAITGSFPIQGRGHSGNDANSPEVFFIAFFKDSSEQRPITFVFPGGPGSSCGPETICSFGPRRILTAKEGKHLLPPYEIVDNPQSLLPWTDLVFIDPVGTGFSTLGNDKEAVGDLFDVDADIEILGNFLRTFVACFNRWNSPKYLAGASYGTTRCCGIADYLVSHDFSLHGLILLSCAIDFSTLISQDNQSLPDALLVPTLAATAWYHKRSNAGKSLPETVEYARRFVYDELIPFMLQPNRLAPYHEAIFYKRFSQLIGLPEELVYRYQGRLDETLYTTEFFGKERRVLGGTDTRYVGDLSSSQRQYRYDDPSYRDMQGLLCAFNEYLHNQLETSRPFDIYVPYSFMAAHSWNFDTYDSYDWPNFIQRIRRTLIRNPQMKIFVGSGYYDCRTPFGATEYCFDHLALPLNYRKNFQFEYYEAGHAFIFDYNCLKKLNRDLSFFYAPLRQQTAYTESH